MPSTLESSVESRYVSTNGIRLHYEVHGAPDLARGTVVLLHGFPDTRRSFDCQIPALVEAGYRCVVPDLRGYGKSDRPRRGYDLDTLGRDVTGLVERLGAPVRLVGHDWGGAITWNVLSTRPELVTRAVIVNAPHPVVMSKALLSNRRQIRRSWYFFFFQLPRVPERWLTKNGGRNIGRMFRAGSPGERDAPRDVVDAARRQLSEPGAIGPALQYYREAVRGGLAPSKRRELVGRYGPIPVPITVIWGVEDACLGTELLEGIERYARDVTVHRIPNAGHFVHQERPEAVNQLLLPALG